MMSICMRKFSAGTIAALLLLCGLPVAARAQVECDTLQHWVALENNLKMNQKHLFCGEWDRNRPKGFHSRPGGVNPDTVAAFSIQDKANAAGVYTGRWSYKNNPRKNKFSSMFPDRCSTDQVLNSIAYAVENQTQCPEGAPNWTQCGPNQPGGTEDATASDAKYCSVNGRFFTIGFAPSRNNRVNTAFPFYQ
ncbi:MAG TPA: hypothetical protein DEF07_01095 [Nitrosomonas sp.]|nr:hypothetical protein [Nitrosomonas sp.]